VLLCVACCLQSVGVWYRTLHGHKQREKAESELCVVIHTLSSCNCIMCVCVVSHVCMLCAVHVCLCAACCVGGKEVWFEMGRAKKSRCTGREISTVDECVQRGFPVGRRLKSVRR